MIGLVTDSTSQIPPDLARRYGVEVVPVVVTLDGRPYREGVDLDADDFYAAFTDHSPVVTTSQPSPGDFEAVYRDLADREVTGILSVHVGSDLSGTVNSARLAAAGSPVPVHVVDTGTASFGVTCCLWEAAESLRAGSTLEEAADIAQAVADRVGTVFVVQAFDVARAGGRYDIELPAEGIPVIAVVGGETAVLAEGSSVDELCAAMTDHMHADGAPIRVAVGIADRSARPFWEAMEARLVGRDDVIDLVRYRVGPSIGAHTGPGTAGGFWYATLKSGPWPLPAPPE